MQNRILMALAGLLMAGSARATIITGTITNWYDSSSIQTIGDGVHNVQMWWSVNAYGSTGYFYGSNQGPNSNVAAAPSITNINQITNAGSFGFTPFSVGPLNDAGSDPDHVGDFVIYRNNTTGYFGVLRIDDINSAGYLSGTWWFQTDGTGNFQTILATPEPSAVFLLGSVVFVVGRKLRANARRT